MRKKELQEKHRHVAGRYKGYEILLDTYDDPSMNIPTGTHTYGLVTLYMSLMKISRGMCLAKQT